MMFSSEHEPSPHGFAFMGSVYNWNLLLYIDQSTFNIGEGMYYFCLIIWFHALGINFRSFFLFYISTWQDIFLIRKSFLYFFVNKISFHFILYFYCSVFESCQTWCREFVYIKICGCSKLISIVFNFCFRFFSHSVILSYIYIICDYTYNKCSWFLFCEFC